MMGLLSALGWLRKLWSALVALVLRYPWQCALVLSLALNVWLWRGWDKEQDGREADRASYVKAQQDAKAKQDAADLANVQAQTDRNKQMEQAHVETEAAVSDALAAYIARNRLRPQAARCPASGAGAPGVHPDPGVPAGEDPAAGMVAVSEDHLDKLSRGAVRGAECVGYLQSLIDAGQAKAWNASVTD